MCGIVGAASSRNVNPILLGGLKRLEYRGYDSAGIALYDKNAASYKIKKVLGKVAGLQSLIEGDVGTVGIAHTRWATHGKPSELNAHPHKAASIHVVHNGIIENHAQLRQELIASGVTFSSDTDTEVIVHLLQAYYDVSGSMLEAFKLALAKLRGAYALCVVEDSHPDTIYFARLGSPMVLGLGIEENFVASDQLALRMVTDRFMFLEEGDFGYLSASDIVIYDDKGSLVERTIQQIDEDIGDADKGGYRHYMLKEIYEQPAAIARTLHGRFEDGQISTSTFDRKVLALLSEVRSICFIACGTSFHAGLVAKYAIESSLGIPVSVEVASEYRYRKVAIQDGTLFVGISQSGETADTLAALRKAKTLNYLGYLAICNVSSSSLVRESDAFIPTNAGPEIGVASTKAFTTQLVALHLFKLLLMQLSGRFSGEYVSVEIENLQSLPRLCDALLLLDEQIQELSLKFANKHHALFLGRGAQYPVALEGALKLKEISYIHAEAYPAGELKHGPLALVDEDMPVIAVAPENELFEKLCSNLEEVKARGGELYVFAGGSMDIAGETGVTVISLPVMPEGLEPLLYSIPLQLLAYHVALVKGTDVDQPRNLAKSVTVE